MIYGSKGLTWFREYSQGKQCDKLNIEYGVYNKNSEPLKHSLWKLNFQEVIILM